jgi:hypothetical protein
MAISNHERVGKALDLLENGAADLLPARDAGHIGRQMARRRRQCVPRWTVAA